jgi:hypothetical protein
MKQHTLFDVLVKTAPKSTREILWSIHHRRDYEQRVLAFRQDYGEPPIFRLRLPRLWREAYCTHPDNALIIDTRTGSLVEDNDVLQQLWGAALPRCPVLRGSQVPEQVAAVLAGERPREAWQPEVSERVSFDEEHADELARQVQASGLGWRLDQLRCELHIWGAPEQVHSLLTALGHRGLIRLLR